VYLGQGTTPLVLLALGVALRPSAVRDSRVPLTAALLLKLGVTPLAMLALGRACGLHGEVAAIGVLQGAMPAAVMASVLSEINDLDGDFAVAAVFVTTILSAVTIPLWLAVGR
jgi:predicted permease